MTWFSHDVIRQSHPDMGSGVEHCFRLGRLHLNVGRAVGWYGYPHTVSWSARAWWA